jgi:hypothetical protein
MVCDTVPELTTNLNREAALATCEFVTKSPEGSIQKAVAVIASPSTASIKAVAALPDFRTSMEDRDWPHTVAEQASPNKTVNK